MGSDVRQGLRALKREVVSRAQQDDTKKIRITRSATISEARVNVFKHNLLG
jgi:hypothetical protein